jgi:hypothetical protein
MGWEGQMRGRMSCSRFVGGELALLYACGCKYYLKFYLIIGTTPAQQVANDAFAFFPQAAFAHPICDKDDTTTHRQSARYFGLFAWRDNRL